MAYHVVVYNNDVYNTYIRIYTITIFEKYLKNRLQWIKLTLFNVTDSKIKYNFLIHVKVFFLFYESNYHTHLTHYIIIVHLSLLRLNSLLLDQWVTYIPSCYMSLWNAKTILSLIVKFH